MQTIESVLRDFHVEADPEKIVRLARSLHRVGISRRKSTPAWQREGIKNCNLARDLVTYAREISKPCGT